ncbi:MAG: hypothetical protein AAB131_13900 [Actinomycetota bacterium]
MLYQLHRPALWVSGRQRHFAPAAKPLAAELRANACVATTIEALGIANADRFWPEVDALLAELEPLGVGRFEGDLSDGRNTAAHCISVDPPELLAKAPQALLAGLDETLLDLAEGYLGVPAAFATVHLRKDLGTDQQVGTRIWHIDTEDHRVLRVIVYLDHVGIDDGPFEYIPLQQTNRQSAQIKDRGYRAAGDPLLDDEMATLVPRAEWRQVTGPRGTVAIADNARLFHHGRPHSSQRLALIYTYTSRSPKYPQLHRNPCFDDRLSKRQRASFFADTHPEA